MSIKEALIGGVVTLVIGGTTYTISQTDVIQNFASDTGLSQQEAKEYVEGVSDDELIPYDKLGADVRKYGEETLSSVNTIDCVNYTYDWESPTLNCDLGKTQLTTLGNDLIALGNAYVRLSADNASKQDISEAVRLIGIVNQDYDFEVVSNVLDPMDVAEEKKANSYNKATLQAALDS